MPAAACGKDINSHTAPIPVYIGKTAFRRFRYGRAFRNRAFGNIGNGFFQNAGNALCAYGNDRRAAGTGRFGFPCLFNGIAGSEQGHRKDKRQKQRNGTQDLFHAATLLLSKLQSMQSFSKAF